MDTDFVIEFQLRSLQTGETAGDYCAWNYFQSLDLAENQAFLKRFRARYGPRRVTSDTMVAAYSPRRIRIWLVIWFVSLLCGLTACAARADDAEIGKVLKEKGVTVTESKGAVIAVAVSGKERLTDEDFALIGRLPHLKSLGVGGGLNDSRLAQLTQLAELESIGTNGAQISDDGLKPLAKLQNLRTLTFYHPGRSFSGAGLAHLAELPHLERLTVAGSVSF